MKKNVFIGTLLLAILTLSSCVTTNEDLGRFTVISSKNVDLSRLGDMQRFPERTETTKFNTKILFITKKISDSYVLENALDSALETIPGAVALVDAKVSYYTRKRLFSSKYGYRFEGTALVDSNSFGMINEIQGNDTLFILSSDDGKNIAFVTEQEFNNALSDMSEF